MKIAISKINNPYYNLSLEETLLKDESIKDDILLLYLNDNTVVFGRNQNIHLEVNQEFVKKNKINLIRRVSGGGAVYHDQGNINFSFITTNEKSSYIKFLEPIIEFLKSLNLNAEFKGKNDLVIDGMKVSGNAQYRYKGRMFHHGTLLFDADLSVLGNVLKVNKLKLESKGIESARQRVSNIRLLLKKDMKTSEFKDKLIKYFSQNSDGEINLDSYKQDEIKALSNVRKSDDWTYGKNPEFNLNNERRFNGGTISVFANIKQNIIKDITFFGDFLSSNDSENIKNYFINKKYNEINISEIVSSIKDYSQYFGKIEKNELIELLLGK